MGIRAEMTGLREALAYHSNRVLSIVDDEVQTTTEGLKTDLRQQTEAALGTRVANAWRGKFFANDGDARGPAAFVWSKAPRILDFFSSSKLVTPIGEAFAIPTENVPRGPRGRRLSPIEVEARFNTELRAVKLKTGKIGLFMDQAGAKSARRSRRRAAKPVLMFVLWKGPMRGPAIIDLQAAADRWGAKTVDNIERRLGEE